VSIMRVPARAIYLALFCDYVCVSVWLDSQLDIHMWLLQQAVAVAVVAVCVIIKLLKKICVRVCMCAVGLIIIS